MALEQDGDCYRLNQVMIPVAAVVTDWFYYMSKWTHPGTIYAAIYLENVFFSQYLLLKTNRSSLLSAGKASKSHLHHRSQRFINPLVLCHNSVQQQLYQISHPQDATLVHYIDIIVLTASSEQELETILHWLVRYVLVRVWEMEIWWKLRILLQWNL